jgi:hypothetical protein
VTHTADHFLAGRDAIAAWFRKLAPTLPACDAKRLAECLLADLAGQRPPILLTYPEEKETT